MLYDHDYVICLLEILDDTQENTFARRSNISFDLSMRKVSK